jgi:pimeloyl-ACP methyl ester carboxylesterase
MCETTFTEVNGAAIRYALSGNGPQTLVLFHELGGSLESWKGLVPLLPENLTVLRADMRGAGMSEKVSGTVDFGVVCDDMVALLDALGITGKVIVAGAAAGGAIAVHFAIRRSNRTAKLILISPALGVPRSSMRRPSASPTRWMRKACGRLPATSSRKLFRIICGRTTTKDTKLERAGLEPAQKGVPPHTARLSALIRSKSLLTSPARFWHSRENTIRTGHPRRLRKQRKSCVM